MGKKAKLPTGLYRRGEVFWLRWTPVPEGAQVRQSLGTSVLVEAIQEAERIKRTDGPVMRAEAGECSAEIDRYVAYGLAAGLAGATMESRRYVLKGFVEELGALTPRHIGALGCERWFAARMEKHAHTAVSYLNQVRWWFAWLMERGVVVRDPTAGIKVPKLKMRHRKVFLLPAEARRLIDECPEDDRDLKFALYCGLHAGMRKLEIIEARPEWFDLEAGLIHVQATPTFEPKGRDNRTIPMTEEFKGWMLKEFPPRAPFVLHPEVGHGKYRYRYDFRKAFEGLVGRCGLECTFHDLRRTFASLLVSKGVSIFKVAKWLGDTLKVVQDTYGHLIPQDDEINASWSR
ncbi:tyrosine-type recombinase/integrase [Prosthecobacter sp.]|uniref:tyrosine-type recombinase/integrase n=1 Tax=Prosthecobacter sp. TaxID=1965333 RepID=UPI003784E5A9